MNPFLVLGCEDPSTPLDPGFQGEESDFVDVDRTEDAFRQFTADFGDGRRVLDRGRFVLVTGPSRCGKTALINRCVRWLESEQHSSLTHFIVDARLDLDETDPLEARINHVGISVVDTLRGHAALPEGSAIVGDPGDPRRIYNRLGHELDDDTFVVVVLPSSGDLIEEVNRYSRMTRPRMLVFAETDRMDLVSGRQGEFAQSPLRLEVGPLREADGDAYAQKRLSEATGWPFDVPPPPIASADLVDFLRIRPVSIGELQVMLYGIYEEFIRSGSPPPMVTEQDFYRYYVKVADGGGSCG